MLSILFFNPTVIVGSLSQKGFTQLNDKVACASLRVQAGYFVENGFGLGLEGKRTSK